MMHFMFKYMYSCSSIIRLKGWLQWMGDEERGKWEGNGSNFGGERNSGIKADFLGKGCVYVRFFANRSSDNLTDFRLCGLGCLM